MVIPPAIIGDRSGEMAQIKDIIKIVDIK